MTIRDCIAPDRNPRKPDISLPKGSIDTHVHIFESQFPLFEGRGYNPPNSTLEDLIHLHTTLGVDRVVFTPVSYTHLRAHETGRNGGCPGEG